MQVSARNNSSHFHNRQLYEYLPLNGILLGIFRKIKTHQFHFCTVVGDNMKAHTMFCLQHPNQSKWVQRAGHIYSIDRPHPKLVLHCAVANGHTRTSTQTLVSPSSYLINWANMLTVNNEQRNCTRRQTYFLAKKRVFG